MTLQDTNVTFYKLKTKHLLTPFRRAYFSGQSQQSTGAATDIDDQLSVQ